MPQNFLSKTEREALAPALRLACSGRPRPEGEAVEFVLVVNPRSIVAVKQGRQRAALVLDVSRVFFVGDRLRFVRGDAFLGAAAPRLCRDAVVKSFEVACLMPDAVCTSAPCGSLLAIMGSRTIWFEGQRADHWARALGFKSYADCKACVVQERLLPTDGYVIRW